MDVSENCKTGSCYLAHRFEIMGIILIIIATFLTIVSFDSFGIVMLFIVGLALCIHKHFSRGHCSWHTTSDMDCCVPTSRTSNEPVPGDTIVKTPKTTKTVKKDIGL